MSERKFRKKPLVVRAVKVGRVMDYPAWLAGKVSFVMGGSIAIQTLEGLMLADIGDWIIEGVKGEIYPCKPDIFEASYDEIF